MEKGETMIKVHICWNCGTDGTKDDSCIFCFNHSSLKKEKLYKEKLL